MKGLQMGWMKLLAALNLKNVTTSVPYKSSKFPHLIRIQSKFPEEWKGLAWTPIKTLGPLTTLVALLGRFPAFIRTSKLGTNFHAGFRLVTSENWLWWCFLSTQKIQSQFSGHIWFHSPQKMFQTCFFWLEVKALSSPSAESSPFAGI